MSGQQSQAPSIVGYSFFEMFVLGLVLTALKDRALATIYESHRSEDLETRTAAPLQR
jgi:hypothetical protein